MLEQNGENFVLVKILICKDGKKSCLAAIFGQGEDQIAGESEEKKQRKIRRRLKGR